MTQEHRTIREMLSRLPLPAARVILKTNLPNREFVSIYYADCEKESLGDIGEMRLNCEETTVKKYRRAGYKKLAALYSAKTK